MSNSPNPDTARERVDDNYAEDLDELDDELDGELDDLDEFDRLDAEFQEGFDSEFDNAGPDDADEEADIAESGGVGRAGAAEYDAAEYGAYDGEYDDEYGDECGDYEAYEEYEEDSGVPRPYRPGRGGFDPEAAALAARAKYAFRQRVVVFMLLLAVVSAVAGGFVTPLAWWGHAGVDVVLVGYLTYLRRQVRIEQEIRDRRAARMTTSTRRVHVQPPQERRRPVPAETPVAEPAVPAEQPVFQRVAPSPCHQLQPGTVVVEADDEDPMFDELDQPDVLPYRRAVGE